MEVEDDMKDWQINLIVILLVVVMFGGAYLISISDLPDWFKFWLLK
jgi:hypothetical protein